MKFVILSLFAALAFGQNSTSQETVVQLANTPTKQGFQEMATVLRTVADISQLSMDQEHSSFTLRGTVDQLGFGEWLLHAMDKPAGWVPSAQEAVNSSTRQYRLHDGGRQPVARVYYLTNTRSPQNMQEIVTVLRTVADAQKAFTYSAARMIAFRDNDASVALDEWLLRELDIPADGQAFARQNQNHAVDTLKLPDPRRDGGEDITRVFYLDPAVNSQEINNLLKTLRTTAKIQKVFYRTSPPVVVVRASPADLTQTEQIIASR